MRKTALCEEIAGRCETCDLNVTKRDAIQLFTLTLQRLMLVSWDR